MGPSYNSRGITTIFVSFVIVSRFFFKPVCIAMVIKITLSGVCLASWYNLLKL